MLVGSFREFAWRVELNRDGCRFGEGMSLTLRVVLALVTAVASAGAAAAIGMFLLLMTAFAFDSPFRETDPATVFRFLYFGLGLAVLGSWLMAAAIAVRSWRMWLLIAGGVVLALGMVGVVTGLGFAIFGG